MKLEQLLGTKFVPGGRTADGIDCLGVALVGCKQLGNPVPDPWIAFLEQWRGAGGGEPPRLPGFPDTWRQVEYADDPAAWCGDVHDGDVWLWYGRGPRMPGAGVVHRGRVWTAHPRAGVVSLEPHRSRKPDEVWRP